jgi:sugar phosphate isomerase/epimerase
MKISIASYAFYGLLGEGKIDVFGYLESAKFRYRLDTADIWNGMLASTEEDYLQKVREALDARELTLVNLCVDGAHLWDPNPEERERLRLVAFAHLHAAVILGAKTVRIDWGVRKPDLTDQEFDLLASRYGEYCQFAADHGFRVGPENHFGAALDADHMVRLAKAINHPAYGILLHMGHWEGDEAEGDRRAAPWLMHTHADARVTATCLEERMTMLLDAGYDGYWGVEHHSGHNEYAEVEWQVAEVKRVLTRRATS